MSRQLVIIDENALVTFVKTALLFFFLTSPLLTLVGLILLFVQARGLAKRVFHSQRQGQEVRKGVDRVVEGKDALDTLIGVWSFSMLQRGRHFYPCAIDEDEKGVVGDVEAMIAAVEEVDWLGEYMPCSRDFQS